MRFHTSKNVPVDEAVAVEKRSPPDAEKDVFHANAPSDSDQDAISLDAQAGVQKIEATTKVWSTAHLIAAYIIIWIIYFIDSLQQGATGALTVYVLSDFAKHSLVPTTNIMSQLIGGILKLPLAKILDIWGRPQGFAISLFLLVVGIIMMAACQNVETYAAAQVFYWVGYNGVGYSLSVFIADTSSLKNRSLMFAYVNSPYIITTWISGYVATAFYDPKTGNGPGWRWGFGTWAIVTPAVCLPLLGLFIWNFRKAKKMGVMPVRESKRTRMQSLKYYAIEFDLLGILLICGGLAMFLLPFSLYTTYPGQWKNPTIICLIIFGLVLIVAFALYEKYAAPVTFIPFHLLTNRTVLGACILSGVLFISFFIWDAYFMSFLQVVNGLTLVEATYVARIYTVGSCFWSLVVALLIRISGRFKWLALYFGLPLNILGVGLMIHFRQPDVNIGYVVMCQIFIAFAGGTLVICEQMAAMAAVSHQHIAVILAIENMFANVGGAIGATVASAVWTGVFPVKLAEYLPEAQKVNATIIYGDIKQQMAYPFGTPARDAINAAYGEAQKDMIIGGTAILVIGFVCIAVWRDINVKEFKQVKGRVV